MSVEVMVAVAEARARAAEIHFQLLPGNNDDRDGSGWLPMTPTGEGPDEVVLVAVDREGVLGYVFGDKNVNRISVCQEVAVLPAARRQGIGLMLLRGFARYAVENWASKWVYLNPLQDELLVAYYRKRGFQDDPEPSGYLRIAAEQLASRS